MQEFRIDKQFINIFKLGIVVFSFFAIFSLLLPILPEDEKSESIGISDEALSILGFAFFGCATWLTFICLQKCKKANILVDDQGIWYKHLSREERLIKWSEISKIKERANAQCLELFNSRNEKLIRIEYQIIDFFKLRQIIEQKVAVVSLEGRDDLNRFTKPKYYHIISLTLLGVFAALGLGLMITESFLIGFIFLIFMMPILCLEYIKAPCAIYINKDSFSIYYPLKYKIIKFTDVSTIQIFKIPQHYGISIPQIEIKLIKGKTIKLKAFKEEPYGMLDSLKKAVKNK